MFNLTYIYSDAPLEIIMFGLLIIALIAFAYYSFLLFLIFTRNDKVHNLRRKILKLEDHYRKVLIYKKYTEDPSIKIPNKWYYDKLPPYDKMLYSFKKLTLENWMSEEDIKELTKYKNEILYIPDNDSKW